jgi:general stress protein YciG
MPLKHSKLEAQNTAPPCPEATPPAGSQRAAGRRCQGTDKSGMPCTAWALRDGTHCFFHANPEKVSELGRRGGEAKGARGARYAERSLKTVDDVTALLGDTIKDLGMGLIDPKEATAVGYCGGDAQGPSAGRDRESLARPGSGRE